MPLRWLQIKGDPSVRSFLFEQQRVASLLDGSLDQVHALVAALLTDETIYLRNAAVNLINGMINMSFSCDGTHYIDHKTFFAKLDNFETLDTETP